MSTAALNNAQSSQRYALPPGQFLDPGERYVVATGDPTLRNAIRSHYGFDTTATDTTVIWAWQSTLVLPGDSGHLELVTLLDSGEEIRLDEVAYGPASAAPDEGLQRQSYSPVDPAFEAGQYRSGAPFLASAAAEVSWTQAGHAFARTGSQVGSGKVYELRDHLGNVAVVVSDRKLGVDGDSDGVAEGFGASIVSARDFYPFGMVMAGRSYNRSLYRYAFQGQEADDEWLADGNAVSFKYRVSDVRLGRFLIVDPLASGYPWNSTYAFAENRVIEAIDLEGAEAADADQVNKAKSMVTQLQNTNIPKGTQAVPNISKKELVYYLTTRLAHPEMKSWWLSCGPTSASYVALTHDPESFTRKIIEIWLSGKSKDGKLVVPEVFLSEDTHYGLGTDLLQDIDRFVEGTIRSSENGWGMEYDMEKTNDSPPWWWSAGNEAWRARKNGTLPSEYPDLVYRITDNIGVMETATDDLLEIGEWTQQGGQGVLFGYYSAILDPQAPISENRVGGNHFITVQSLSVSENGQSVTISFWHHGEYSNNGYSKSTYTMEKFRQTFSKGWWIKQVE